MGPPGINKAKQQKKLIEWRCRLQNGIKSLPDTHLHRKLYNIGSRTKLKQQKLNKKKKLSSKVGLRSELQPLKKEIQRVSKWF